MTSTLGTLVALFGLAVASGALLLLLHVSGLGAGNSDFGLVYAAVATFLIGIFIFGWGLGKRTGP